MPPKTYLSQEYVSFPDIGDDRRILSTEFLKASTQLLPFIDTLGKGFGIIKNDVSGNIEKLKKKQTKNPEKFQTINDMLEDEVENRNETLAQVGALWLKRGLDFLCTFLELLLQNKDNPSESTKPYLSEAYAKTLKPYHNFVLTSLFSGLSRMIQHKSTLIQQLKIDDTVEDSVVFDDMKICCFHLRENVAALDECLRKLKFESD